MTYDPALAKEEGPQVGFVFSSGESFLFPLSIPDEGGGVVLERKTGNIMDTPNNFYITLTKCGVNRGKMSFIASLSVSGR